MKNKKLLLALLAAGVLASCNSGDLIGGLEKGEDVLNGSLVEGNLPEVEEVEVVNKYVKSKVGEHSVVRENNSVTEYDQTYGLLKTKSEKGYVGFYSVLAQKQILANQFVPEWLTWDVVNDANLGYMIKIRYEGVVSYYDPMGNLIHQGNELDDSDVTITSRFENETVYLHVEYREVERDSITGVEEDGFSNLKEKSFKYNETGKLVSINNIESDILNNMQTPEVDENKFPFGSQYNTEVSLEEYGLEGYVANSENLYTVYDGNHQKVTSFKLPAQILAKAIITNKLYYQVAEELADDASNYGLLLPDGTKANLKTWSINLETGEKVEEDVQFLIGGATPYSVEGSDQKYSILTMYVINESKSLSSPEQYLIDSKGVLHDQVTGMNMGSFLKVGNSFYNDTTKILYDANLNELSYLGGIEKLKLIPEYNLFTGKVDGKYGLIDSNGKVVLDFTNEKIFPEISNEKVIVQKPDGSYCRCDLATGSVDALGDVSNFKEVADGLYEVRNSEREYELHSTSQKLHTIDYSNYSTDTEILTAPTYRVYENNINNAKYVTMYYATSRDYTEYDENNNPIEKVEVKDFSVTFDINKLEVASTVGSEGTEKINLGKELKSAFEIDLGEFDYHYTSGSTYYSFTPELDGYYTIKSSDDLQLYSQNGTTFARREAYYGEYVEWTIKLDAEEEFFFTVSRTTSGRNYFALDLSLEKGDNSSYPLYVGEGERELLLNSSGYGYVVLSSKYDGYYTIKLANEDNNQLRLTVEDKVYSNGEEIYLEAGSQVPANVSIMGMHLNKEEYPSTISLTPVVEGKDGSSLRTAIPVAATPAEADTPTYVYIDSTDYTYGNYFKYSNTTDKAQVVKFATQFTGGTWYPTVNVYSDDQEVLASGVSMSFTSTVNSYSYVVPAGQTVYLELPSHSYDLQDQTQLPSLSITTENSVQAGLKDPQTNSDMNYDLAIGQDMLFEFTVDASNVAYLQRLYVAGDVATQHIVYDANGKVLAQGTSVLNSHDFYEYSSYVFIPKVGDKYFVLVKGAATANNVTARISNLENYDVNYIQYVNSQNSFGVDANDTKWFVWENPYTVSKKVTIKTWAPYSTSRGIAYYYLNNDLSKVELQASVLRGATEFVVEELKPGERIYIKVVANSNGINSGTNGGSLDLYIEDLAEAE